ncbi:MAG TPA: hypothetical protein VLA92_01475 [Candidatus Saccharimonadales bacterium]|nr:hypothetical protein [Candidatus Saccharimonadales bacterium]
MSTQPGKDVIYIDIDDEITTLIDKVRGSEERIVALVLPKRATVLQSIVNMKLLKRTADSSKKHLVLITNEIGLLPLAGAVGIYVAKSLQTRPEIPPVPGGGSHEVDDTEEAVDMNDEPKLDKSKAVGDHAKGAAAGSVVTPDEDLPIELDNTSDATTAAASATKPKAKKDKRLKIPDFDKFRLWIALGVIGLVFIIFLFWIALSVMPRATVTVKTDSQAINTTMDVTLSTSAKEVNVDSAVVPATAQQTQKDATQQAPATGEKDKGTKASGSVNLALKDCSVDQVSIPAGTTVSTNGLNFVTQDTATMTSVKVGNQCKNSQFTDYSTDTVAVIAQSAGDKYNVGSANYSVSGFSSVTGSAGPMTGGTTNIVKIVQQADVDSAKQKIANQDLNAIKAELKSQLQGQGLMAIEGSLASDASEVSLSAQVGAEAEAVTVSQKTTYTMMGVKQADLKKLIANEVNKQIDPTKQTILDYGLDEADFKIQNSTAKTTLVSMDDTAIAGSDLDLTDIKKQIAGKKSAEAEAVIGKYPGVTSVDVHYSPFWVSSIPKNTGKITVSVEKPAVKNAD